MRVLIYGAGSAGIHHAHAARALGWDVYVIDTDQNAFRRMPEIYTNRYGEWDKDIWFGDLGGGYDLAIIATPPETHLTLAFHMLDSKKADRILIEKVAVTTEHVDIAKSLVGQQVFVGYGHALKAHVPWGKDLNKLYVRWTESWDFLLAAHPWMNSPHDSYLGSWERGGGALQEHSHGLNMFQRLSHDAWGEVVEVKADITFEGGYDCRAFLTLKTESGHIGNVLQDVVSRPAVKWASTGQSFDGCPFKEELEHVVTADAKTSPIGIERGLRTAEVIAAAFKSAQEGGRYINV